MITIIRPWRVREGRGEVPTELIRAQGEGAVGKEGGGGGVQCGYGLELVVRNGVDSASH